MADKLDAQDNLLGLVLRYLVVRYEVDNSALERYEFHWLDVEELLVAGGFGAIDVDSDDPLKTFVASPQNASAPVKQVSSPSICDPSVRTRLEKSDTW